MGNLEGLGIGDYDSGIIAAGALFLYLKETQKTALVPYGTVFALTLPRNTWLSTAPPDVIWSLWKPCVKNRKEVLFSGYWTRPKQLWEPEHFGTYVEQPLIDAEEIEKRLDALEELNQTIHVNGMRSGNT